MVSESRVRADFLERSIRFESQAVCKQPDLGLPSGEAVPGIVQIKMGRAFQKESSVR